METSTIQSQEREIHIWKRDPDQSESKVRTLRASTFDQAITKLKGIAMDFGEFIHQTTTGTYKLWDSTLFEKTENK